MSSERDNEAIEDLETVTEAYRRAGFDDEPPAHVDAFIRAAAKRESKRGFNAYLPSLAMAATIVLALGLVLRLTVPGRDLLEPASAPEADEATATRLERVAPLEDSAAPAAEFVPAPEDVADQILRERVIQLEEVATPARASSAAEEVPAEMNAASGQADMLQRDGVASSVAGRMASPLPVAVPCTEPERGDPDRWLACMTAQINAGLLDEARAELEQFRLAFADYSIPANVIESLEP